MTRFLPAAAVILALALPALADDTPITNPIRYTWIAATCPDWNCAASAFMMANGDKNVIVMPTGRAQQPFIVLKRVEEGSIYIPDDEPYACQTFDNVDGAATHLKTIDGCHAPMLLNVTDGRTVIASLQKCGDGSSRKRRATR
jgi:hypothetical protein